MCRGEEHKAKETGCRLVAVWGGGGAYLGERGYGSEDSMEFCSLSICVS